MLLASWLPVGNPLEPVHGLLSYQIMLLEPVPLVAVRYMRKGPQVFAWCRPFAHSASRLDAARIPPGYCCLFVSSYLLLFFSRYA